MEVTIWGHQSGLKVMMRSLFKKNVPLDKYSSYKIGGPARYFYIARTETGLKNALREARRQNLKVFFLGGATNLLIPDTGFDGLVVVCGFKELKRSKNLIICGAGVSMAKLINFAAKENLSGLEWAGGLPGTVGGAVRGNAGAFGGETKDTIRAVRSMEAATLKVIARSRVNCNFGYRSSIFKEKQGQEVILSATFVLKKGKSGMIRKNSLKNIRHRLERHPMEYPNIGSIFKNVPVANIPKARRAKLAYDPKLDPIPVVPAARLITMAGLKGRRQGGAQISEKHPNFIINRGGAKAKDVLKLIDLVKKTIKKKYDVTMEPEVQIL